MIRGSRTLTLPRWVAFLFWPVALLLSMAGLPAGLAQNGPRRGWRQGRPGAWNLLGFALLIPGLALLAWNAYLHFAHSPSRVEVPEAAPPYLLAKGPYAWSRNPMYVAGMITWAGWAVYYGSFAVVAGMVPFWGAIALLAVPFEERHLEARLGEPYLRYKRSVPRWLGRPRPRGV